MSKIASILWTKANGVCFMVTLKGPIHPQIGVEISVPISFVLMGSFAQNPSYSLVNPFD